MRFHQGYSVPYARMQVVPHRFDNFKKKLILFVKSRLWIYDAIFFIRPYAYTTISLLKYVLSCLTTCDVRDLIFSQFSIDRCQKCVCFRGSAPDSIRYTTKLNLKQLFQWMCTQTYWTVKHQRSMIQTVKACSIGWYHVYCVTSDQEIMTL